MKTERQQRRAGTSNRRGTPAPQRSLEEELGPAVLDACRAIWSEFVELSSFEPRSFGDDEQELLHWYAELQFRLGAGGGRCSECGAHVRHALPMRVEMEDSILDFRCLCTRCMVAFEQQAERMWYTVAGRFIEHPIRCGRAEKIAA